LSIERKIWTSRVIKRLQELAENKGIQLVEVSEFSLSTINFELPGQAQLIVRQLSPWNTARNKNEKNLFLDRFLQQQSTRKIAESSQLVTCPSQCMADLIENKWKISPYKIVIYPNPLDTGFFTPLEGVEVQGNSILFAGRFERMKGVESLVRAISNVKKSIPGIRLQMINAGGAQGDSENEYETFIRRKISDYGLEKNTDICPRLTQDELVKAYCRAAVVVVPSLWESLPYAVLEPMSCGRPVIANNCGGIPEIIHNQMDGLLADPLNVNSLTGKILRLLRNPGLAQELGRNARERIINRFSLSVVSREVDIIYRELCI
jgi:glycosyltransferase involved in cell wall biosynthesis